MDLANIHQTRAFKHFREAAKGEKYFEIVIDRRKKLRIKAYIQKMPLPFGKCWLYCNRGPVFGDLKEGFLIEFLEDVREIARKEGAVFLRIEPPFKAISDDAREYLEECAEIGFVNAHASHQPEYTNIIDLRLSEEEILGQMKQKGRYNIKVAEKKGVTVRESQDIDAFYSIFQETTQRDQFRGHDKEFYKKMLSILGAEDMAKLYLAEYKGAVIAGIIVTFYKDTATYYYGASSNEARNVMAPYLLQWHAIKEAKSRGMKHYDFLGIAPPGALNHPWRGIGEFKLKFGGKIVQYVKAQEYVFKPFWYLLIRIAKKFRR